VKVNTHPEIAVRLNNECSNNSTPSYESIECRKNNLYFKFCMYFRSNNKIEFSSEIIVLRSRVDGLRFES